MDTTIHIINPLWNAAGGSEQRALALYRLLSPHARVKLWATAVPHPLIAAEYPLNRVRPFLWQFPKTGTFVFVGVYYWLTSWVRLIRPQRCIVIYNTREDQKLRSFVERLGGADQGRIEMVYASAQTRESAGLPGIVQESPIDLQRFSPGPETDRPFTVGRLSRDTPDKFHPDAGRAMRRLAAANMQVRIMGGTCLAPDLSGVPGVTLLPALSMPAETFLRSLDCLYYRTHPDWHETFGRVVFEAMACGVVPVLEARGDYSSYITHGENGFLFTTAEEACSQLCLLRDNKELRQSMSRAARRTVERMYDEAYERRLIDYYLGRTTATLTQSCAAA